MYLTPHDSPEYDIIKARPNSPEPDSFPDREVIQTRAKTDDRLGNKSRRGPYIALTSVLRLSISSHERANSAADCKDPFAYKTKDCALSKLSETHVIFARNSRTSTAWSFPSGVFSPPRPILSRPL